MKPYGQISIIATIFLKKINLAIKKNNEIFSINQLMNLSIGPCTHFYNGNDFK